MTRKSPRPLNLIDPEHCFCLILESSNHSDTDLKHTLSELNIVTISETAFMETFEVSGALMSIMGDSTKRQLIIASNLDYAELPASTFWGLENGLDVFISVRLFDLSNPAHQLLAQRLRSSGATLMCEENCISELQWDHKSSIKSSI